MKKRLFLRIGLVLLLSAGLSAPGWAQAGRGKGRLAGTVKDADGRPIADVRILLEHTLGFKAETRSNAMGQWAIAGLGTGDVTILFLAEGFPPTTARAKVRQLSPNPPLPIVLKPLAGDRPAEGAGLPIPPADRRSVQLTLYIDDRLARRSEDGLRTPDFGQGPGARHGRAEDPAEFPVLYPGRHLPLTLREGDSCDVQLFAKPPRAARSTKSVSPRIRKAGKKCSFDWSLQQYNPLLNDFSNCSRAEPRFSTRGIWWPASPPFRTEHSLALIVGAEIK